MKDPKYLTSLQVALIRSGYEMGFDRGTLFFLFSCSFFFTFERQILQRIQTILKIQTWSKNLKIRSVFKIWKLRQFQRHVNKARKNVSTRRNFWRSSLWDQYGSALNMPDAKFLVKIDIRYILSDAELGRPLIRPLYPRDPFSGEGKVEWGKERRNQIPD